jgi:hypothetical protein
MRSSIGFLAFGAVLHARFAVALAQLLAPGSTIYAVDLDRRTLEGIPDQHDGVETRKIVGDLQSSSLRLPPADGILMANTLHFI